MTRRLLLSLACLALFLAVSPARAQAPPNHDAALPTIAEAESLALEAETLATRMEVTLTVLQAATSHGLPADVGMAVLAVSERYGLDPLLVCRVIEIESDWDPGAVSRSGAVGLMQVMSGTAAAMGFDPARLTEAEYNIEAGCRYLAEMVARFGLTAGLVAYNEGPRDVGRGSRSEYSAAVLQADADD
ncbi:MAG TPA: transglycosylase SLT domain-containing protein [Bacillota bacterium]|jgi:soluble lytic murein transglycosylase-like protein